MSEKDKDEVYHDRNVAACAFVASTCDAYPGGWTPAPDTDDENVEWAIVWLELPQGQVSWHVPRVFAQGVLDRNDDYDYDGHSTDEKNDRVVGWMLDKRDGEERRL